MQPPLSQSMSSLKVNNHGNRGTTKHFWLIKSLSKLFPFAELSVLEVAQSLRIPRRLVLSTCVHQMVSFLLKRPPGFEDLVQEERDQEGHNRDDGGQEEPRTCVKMLRVSSHVQEARSCSDMPVVVQAFHYHLLNEKTLPNALRTQASIALASNFGLVW